MKDIELNAQTNLLSCIEQLFVNHDFSKIKEQFNPINPIFMLSNIVIIQCNNFNYLITYEFDHECGNCYIVNDIRHISNTLKEILLSEICNKDNFSDVEIKNRMSDILYDIVEASTKFKTS